MKLYNSKTIWKNWQNITPWPKRIFSSSALPTEGIYGILTSHLIAADTGIGTKAAPIHAGTREFSSSNE